MASPGFLVVRFEFASTFDATELVEHVGDQLGRSIGLDDDALHWVGVSVRECVINAVKHGNRHDRSKRVFVELETRCGDNGPELMVSVRDQGDGFEPDTLADPLAPENLLKASGRGIFLIRAFMDDVRLRRIPEGGMEIVMIKRVHQPASAIGALDA